MERWHTITMLMYPEDRVLVALVPGPRDFKTIVEESWYRIPQIYAPKGLYAEYLAFYFGRLFGAEKWAIHYFARNLGHELVTRRTLFPDEGDHPRADHLYYKIQLGDLQQLAEPIISLRWRRVTFIHTTWDRFQVARELNDLFVDGGEFVDRLYATLKERGVQAERGYEVHEPAPGYRAALVVPCRNGRVELHPNQIPTNDAEVLALADEFVREVALKGGPVSEG
jgi:hypothetical protein